LHIILAKGADVLPPSSMAIFPPDCNGKEVLSKSEVASPKTQKASGEPEAFCIETDSL